MGGAHTLKARGAVTLESAGDVGVAARGGLAAQAGGTLALHGGGGHVVSGGRVAHHPSGGGAPGVSAPAVAATASAFAKPAGPPKGRLTHTGDPAAPRAKGKAGGAAPQRVTRQAAPTKSTSAKPAARFDRNKVWAEARSHTRAILATGGGTDGDADPIKRNRAISRAYAELYRATPQLVWSGLAAVTSAQAGCAMVQAKPIADMDGVSRKVPPATDPQSPESAGAGLGVAIWDRAGHEAAIVAKGTADANKVIFSDIYPAMYAYHVRLQGARARGGHERLRRPRSAGPGAACATATPAGFGQGGD